MQSALEIMSENEVRGVEPTSDEPGFGSLSTARGHLPLEAMSVDAKIDGLVAHTSLRQTFVNTIGEPLEATYIFPLPDRAAVTSFRMEVAGRVIEGVIKPRQEARRTYDAAIKSGHRAAITEEERAGVFTMRVGNLMPRERATVQLTLVGPVPYDAGEATFQFPLVVAPRYMPGQALGGDNVGDGVATDTDAVPDASRISPPVLLPGYPNPVRLSMSVELNPGEMPISGLRSSLHSVITSSEGRRQRVELLPGERLNRDFILRFGVGEEAVRTSVVFRPDAPGAREGTFLLTAVPPVELSRSTRPRDVIFVLDRSGSMGGWKMVAARRAVGRMIDTLGAKDRFGVLAFDDRIETPPEQVSGMMVASNRNRFRAVEFLAKLEARGGTEMKEPLERAVLELAGGYDDRERTLVLVTDGQVGNEDQIIKGLKKHLKNVRIFTLGVDQAVNAAFLRRLATLGGGLSELVESEDRLDEVMDKIHRRIGLPVLTETSLIASGVEVVPGSISPERIPDLFAGAPLVIGGRYRGNAEGAAMELRGRDGAGLAWSQVVRGQVTDHRAIASMWARSRVRDLEDRFITATSDRDRLEREIVQVSLQHSVLCRFTAFVAVDEAERVNPGGAQHQVTQGVEAPAGWEGFGGGGPGGVPMASAGMPHGMSVGRARMAAAPAPMALKESAVMYDGAFDDAADEVAEMEMSDLAVPGGAMDKMADLRAAPPSQAPRPAKAKGAVQRLMRSLMPAEERESSKKRKQEREEGGGGDGFEAYRDRARAMRDQLRDAETRGATPQVRMGILGMLTGRLRALLEDLRSAGAQPAVVYELDTLLNALTQLLSAAAPSDEEITQAWAAAGIRLEAFVGARADGPPTPGGERSDEFWKQI